MPGTVLQLTVKSGDDITVDQELLIIEAMKMETLVQAKQNGIVREIRVKEGDLLVENQVLILMEQSENLEASTQNMEAIDPDYIRPDLAEVHQRKAFLLDENRPEAVEKRRKSGQYTARENIAALCDPDSFMEYGGLIIAAQRKRRKMDDLLQNTPADGLV